MKINNSLEVDLFNITASSICCIQTSENKITIFHENIHMVLKNDFLEKVNCMEIMTNSYSMHVL